WEVTGVDSGSVNISGASTVTFLDTQNLTGGSVRDSFTFANGSTVGGTIDGGLGSDNLDLSAYDHSLYWNVTQTNEGNVQAVVGKYQGIENLSGSSASDTFTFGAGGAITGTIYGRGIHDTLYLSYVQVPLTWNITGLDSGSVQNGSTVIVEQFQNMENLSGGQGGNTFTVGLGGGITGTITGSDDYDTLDVSAYQIPLTWHLHDCDQGELPTVVNAFTRIDIVDGGSGNDTFTLANQAAFTGRITGNGGLH